MENKRNYGIELLRIISMFMIVILHILNKGGILSNVNPLSLKYNVAWLLDILCVIAVNCYALISGWGGFAATYKYEKIIYLWIKVLFYTIGITFLFQIFFPDLVSVRDWIEAFTPIMSKEYWYVTAYVGLYFFVPILNVAIEKISQKEYKKLLIIMFLFFSVLQTLFRKDTFNLEFGYTTWWLAFLYLLGAYVGKYKILENIKRIYFLLLYILCCTITWLFKILFEYATWMYIGEMIGGGIFVEYISPTIVVASLGLFLFFERLEIKWKKLLNIIRWSSPLAFGVYLIHTQDLIWNNFFDGYFIKLADETMASMLLKVFFYAGVIFCGCVLTDYIREKLFKMLYVKSFVNKIMSFFEKKAPV